jgi:predicted nuclease of predicted toxin-antitoxin system
VRFLLDQNLSWRLVRLLSSEFPEVHHVSGLGLSQSTDLQIWQLATTKQFTIISKDSDFLNFTTQMNGFPKFIWLKMPSANTESMARVILEHRAHISEFSQSNEVTLVIPVRPPEEVATV